MVELDMKLWRQVFAGYLRHVADRLEHDHDIIDMMLFVHAYEVVEDPDNNECVTEKAGFVLGSCTHLHESMEEVVDLVALHYAENGLDDTIGTHMSKDLDDYIQEGIRKKELPLEAATLIGPSLVDDN